MFVMLSAGLTHTMGQVLALSADVLPFIDAATFSSVTFSFLGILAVSIVTAITLDQLLGAAYPYKRHDRDRRSGANYQTKQSYLDKNDHESNFMVPLLASMCFFGFYLRGFESIVISIQPVLFLMSVFLLHCMWAVLYNFSRKNQSPPAVRWAKIMKVDKTRAIKCLISLIRKWMQNRWHILLYLTCLATGAARITTIEQNISNFDGPFGQVQGAIVLRNADGFIVSNSLTNKIWFVSYGGIALPLNYDEFSFY